MLNGYSSSDGTVHIYNGAASELYQEIVKLHAPTVAIMDPPYSETLNMDLIECVPGNALVFCKPENQYFHPDEYLFWVKPTSTKNYKNKCGRFVEMILVRRRGATFNTLHWSQMTGVYDDRLIYAPVHPFEKPLALIERLIRIYTNPGDTVVDWFAGSMTTGIACRELGRSFVGVEISTTVFMSGIVRFLSNGLHLVKTVPGIALQ